MARHAKTEGTMHGCKHILPLPLLMERSQHHRAWGCATMWLRIIFHPHLDRRPSLSTHYHCISRPRTRSTLDGEIKKTLIDSILYPGNAAVAPCDTNAAIATTTPPPPHPNSNRLLHGPKAHTAIRTNVYVCMHARIYPQPANYWKLAQLNLRRARVEAGHQLPTGSGSSGSGSLTTKRSINQSIALYRPINRPTAQPPTHHRVLTRTAG